MEPRGRTLNVPNIYVTLDTFHESRDELNLLAIYRSGRARAFATSYVLSSALAVPRQEWGHTREETALGTARPHAKHFTHRRDARYVPGVQRLVELRSVLRQARQQEGHKRHQMLPVPRPLVGRAGLQPRQRTLNVLNIVVTLETSQEFRSLSKF